MIINITERNIVDRPAIIRWCQANSINANAMQTRLTLDSDVQLNVRVLVDTDSATIRFCERLADPGRSDQEQFPTGDLIARVVPLREPFDLAWIQDPQ